MKKIYLFTLLCLPALLQAANLTSNIKATANLKGFCSFSIADVHFGNLGASSTSVMHPIEILCSNKLPYTIYIKSTDFSGTTNPSSPFSANRIMKAQDVTNSDTIMYGVQMYDTAATSFDSMKSDGTMLNTNNYNAGTGTGRMVTRYARFGTTGALINGVNAEPRYAKPGIYSATNVVDVVF